jgi:hypothetical protein
LLLDISNGRAVGGYFGWKTGFGQIRATFCDSFCSSVKVADADEFGYIGENDLLAFEILRVDGLPAIVGSWRISSERRGNRGDGFFKWNCLNEFMFGEILVD